MKIRTEFVTNSSSTSFGAAVVQSLTTVAAVGGLAAVIAGLEEMARTGIPEIPADLDPSQLSELERGQLDLQDQIDRYENEWRDLQNTLDPDSPDYDKARQEYEEYLDYLRWQREDLAYQEYERQVLEWEQEMARAAQDRFVTERQQDLKNILEAISYTEATRQGYGSHGFDVSEHERRLADLRQREREIRGELGQLNASIDYIPRDRDPIGPSQEILNIRSEGEAARQSQAARDEAERRERYEAARQRRDAGAQASELAQADGDFYGRLERGAEIVQGAADRMISFLSKITGPPGKKVEAAYLGLRGLGSGLGEGMAASGDYARHLTEGALQGASDMVENTLSGRNRAIFTTASEAGRSALRAHLDGEDALEAAGRGAIRGGFTAAGNELGDRLLPTSDLAVDFANTPIGDVIRDIPGDVARQAVKDQLSSEGGGMISDVVQGGNIPFTDWNHGLAPK